MRNCAATKWRSLRQEDSDVVILGRRYGKRCKANILATLTSKILRTMFQKGAPIEQGVETIARTLPICQVRQVAYSTFSILQIFIMGKLILWNMTIRDVFLSGTAN